MTVFNAVLNWIKAHAKLSLAAGAVLLLLILWAFGGIGSAIESIRGKVFDSKQAAYEKQVTDLKAERDQAIQRANDAEAKALLKESEAKELRDLIQAKGGQIETAAKELEKKLDEAKKGAGDCQALTDDVARLNCLCGKLKSAGFECN